MHWLDGFSIWTLAGVIFALRICDVSLGTIRTISVVHGRVLVAVSLGFVELLLWTLAISQVIRNLSEYPVLAVAYAGGFATGNAMGVTIEKKLAMGRTALRIISERGSDIANALRTSGQHLLTVSGIGRDGPTALVYATCARRDMRGLIDRAKDIDPKLFYVVERYAETSQLSPVTTAAPLTPLQPTGWRAVLKKK
jgi:uncharacterized protein YebE (UPF0316 family)